MERVIYSNRTGMMNIFFIFLALALAAVIIVGQEGGKNLVMISVIMGGLFVFSMLVLWIIIKLVASRNIVHLVQTATGMSAEMTHMLGRGKVIALPTPKPEDWSWEVRRVGKRGSERAPVLKFKANGAVYTLWVGGPKVFDKEAFRQLAPVPMQEMEAAGFLK